MARYYQTLAPARYQVREGVRGGWYILDTLIWHDCKMIFKGNKREYWTTHKGALNTAIRLNNQKG